MIGVDWTHGDWTAVVIVTMLDQMVTGNAQVVAVTSLSESDWMIEMVE